MQCTLKNISRFHPLGESVVFHSEASDTEQNKRSIAKDLGQRTDVYR